MTDCKKHKEPKVAKESSTHSENNLNTKNLSEDEDASHSLNVINGTSENEAEESEQESSQWQKKADKFAEGANSLKPTEYPVKKTA